MADAINYRELASLVFPDPILDTDMSHILECPDNIPFPKKPDSMQPDQYSNALETLEKQWESLCETYLLHNSPKLVAISNSSSKAVEELLDLGFFHPDLIADIYRVIYDNLLNSDFEAFLETKPDEEAIEITGSEINPSTKWSSELESEESGGSHQQSESQRISLNHNPSIKKNPILSSRVAVPKSNAKPLTVSTATPRISSTVNPTNHSEITIDQVLNDLTTFPYSIKDYRAFLKISLSEENLDFLIEVLNYQKLALKLYPAAGRIFAHNMELLEQATSLPAARKPDEMNESLFQEEIKLLKTTAGDITNKYLRPNSPQEVNLPSKSLKPMMTLLDTGYFNPEVFQEAYDHIRDMLHQNGFESFLKAAALTAAVEVISPTSQEGIKHIEL